MKTENGPVWVVAVIVAGAVAVGYALRNVKLRKSYTDPNTQGPDKSFRPLKTVGCGCEGDT